MATEVNKILLEVEVNSKGVVKNLGDINKQLSQVGLEAKKSQKALDGMGGAAGIAGATAAEFGRLISDLPYGIQAVTNNISQLGSMFSLLVASSNGVDDAFKNLKRVMAGPAGTLILFQSAVAVVEMLSQAFRKNQAEAKKEAEELKNLNEALEKQETLLLSSARTAALYSKDVVAALGDNVKEVTGFLSEVRKEGPITQELFGAAIDAGRKLLEARKEQNLIEKEIIKTQERLNELGGQGATIDEIRTVAVKKYDLVNKKLMSMFKPKLTLEEATNKVLNERKQILGDLNLLSLKQGEANEKEAEALKLLNYQATEEVVVEGKVKKAKEESNDERQKAIDLKRKEAEEAISGIIKGLADERQARALMSNDLISYYESELNIVQNHLNNKAYLETLSFEERKALLLTEAQLTKRLRDEQLREDLAVIISKQAMYSAISGSLNSLSGLFGEATNAGKGFALAQIAFDVATGYTQGLDIAQKTSAALGPGAAFAFPIFYAQQIASVLAAAGKAKDILSQSKAGSGGVVNATAPQVSSQGPQFNVVGAAGQNQLAAAIAGTQQQPVKAYVVSSDVTTAQQLDRNIIQSASI